MGIGLGFPGPALDQLLRINEISGVQVTTGPAYGEGVLVPNLFFVDAVNGSDSNDGRDPRTPLVTIQAAIDKCVTDRGDRIYIMPGSYDENLLLTGKNYVHLIGVFTGYGRPDVVPTAGTALDTGSAQGTVCQGIRFYSADSDVVIQRGNGFTYRDCVFDGDTGMAATEALVRLKGVTNDDSYTASEGLFEDCLLRGSNGYGAVTDVGNGVGNQVGATHNVFRRCRFVSNVAADVIALDTSGGPGVYSMKDTLFDQCYFGMGTGKNKATHIDISTNLGSANTGNVFCGCYVNDDTIDTTAIKAASTSSSFIGCYNLDGVINGDALD